MCHRHLQQDESDFIYSLFSYWIEFQGTSLQQSAQKKLDLTNDTCVTQPQPLMGLSSNSQSANTMTLSEVFYSSGTPARAIIRGRDCFSRPCFSLHTLVAPWLFPLPFLCFFAFYVPSPLLFTCSRSPLAISSRSFSSHSINSMSLSWPTCLLLSSSRLPACRCSCPHCPWFSPS